MNAKAQTMTTTAAAGILLAAAAAKTILLAPFLTLYDCGVHVAVPLPVSCALGGVGTDAESLFLGVVGVIVVLFIALRLRQPALAQA
jgi:hypothetical protein